MTTAQYHHRSEQMEACRRDFEVPWLSLVCEVIDLWPVDELPVGPGALFAAKHAAFQAFRKGRLER